MELMQAMHKLAILKAALEGNSSSLAIDVQLRNELAEAIATLFTVCRESEDLLNLVLAEMDNIEIEGSTEECKFYMSTGIKECQKVVLNHLNDL